MRSQHHRQNENGSVLTMLIASRYWRAADAERVLEAWRRSGQSGVAFAREHGLSRARLVRWRDRLKQSMPPVFHPVRVVARQRPRPIAAVPPEPLELELRGGRRIHVRAGFDAALLAELVQVVEGWRC